MKKYIKPICQIEEVEVCKVMALSVNDKEGFVEEGAEGGHVKIDEASDWDAIW